MNWFQRARDEWVAEALRVYGFVNRDHLVRKFGISTAQASADLKRFAALRPGAMRYDLTRKCYVRGEA